MSENYEQPSELKSVPNETVPTAMEINMKCEGCGEVADSIDGMLSHKCKPNTPASDQPEILPGVPSEPLFKTEAEYQAFRDGFISHMDEFYEKCRRPIAAEKREVGKATCRNCGATYEFSATEVAMMLQTEQTLHAQISTLQQQLAQAHKDTRTCGEISCDECNERYQKAIAEISTLRRQLAQAQQLNDIMHKFSVFCHSKTCIHHTDAERQGSGCPVCLQKQLAQEKEEREKAETLIRHLPCHCGNFGPNLKCPCCQAKDAIQRWANEAARAALQQSEGG